MNIVEAVKTEGEAEVIARKLSKNARGNPMYADIWRFGVNTALRISDLLSLTFEDVVGNKLVIKESMTGKTRHIDLNSSAKRIVAKRRQAHPDHTFLLQVDSNRAKGEAVSRVAVAGAFKAVGYELGIHLGTHSMRKTRGWLMYSGGVCIEKICKVLKNSSSAVTMTYIGINQAEVDATHREFVF